MIIYVLYNSHNGINHNLNTNTYSYAKTGGLCCFRYERFINFLTSVQSDMRRETQFLLCWPPSQRAVHLVMFKISVGKDLKKPNYIFQQSKSNSRPNGPISTDVISKSSNSHDHLFRAWRHPHSSPISCLGVYYDKWWLSYFVHERNCTKWLYTWI